MKVVRGERARRDAASEPLPAWLVEELLELAEAFDHLPRRARHAAMKRNMSRRAWDEFDARVDRRLRELDEREGPF